MRIYLEELSLHFHSVIMITNRRTLNAGLNELPEKVKVMFVKNEGYDVGMFYKAIQTIDLESYDQIACINDSNVLFNKLKPIFDWEKSSQLDLWGLVDSYQKPWFSTHEDNYHIQSYFLIFNKKAIEKLPVYFKTLDLDELFIENDHKRLRNKVINDWEIGLTQFMLMEGLSIGSYIDSKSFSRKYNINKSTNLSNGSFYRLIAEGYPLIKKKVIFKNSMRYMLSPKKYWYKLIIKYGNKNWDLDSLLKEMLEFKKASKAQFSRKF